MKLVLDYGQLNEGHKTMALELASVGLTAVDYVADTVVPDELAAEIFGLKPNVPVTRDVFHARIHPDDRPMVLAEVDKLIDPDFEDAIEITHRTLDDGGNIRWVQARKKLYREPGVAGGRAVSGVAAILDITACKSAEEASQFLLNELQHRTGNVIAVISAIARMVYDAGPPDTFWSRFQPRIDNLAKNSRINAAKPSRDLRDALNAALSPFVAEAEKNVRIDGPEINLHDGESRAFAMIFHELATNSVKHGALGERGAMVEITWGFERGGDLVLRWVESRQSEIRRASCSGFGTMMLEGFASMSLNARASQRFEPYAYTYELCVPARKPAD